MPLQRSPSMKLGVSAASFSLLLALTTSSCGRSGAPQPKRPNLLLISVDSLRRDHVGPYGYRPEFAGEEGTTPAIARLASEGVLFEDAKSTTCWTLPAHMSLMTGMPSALHGVTDNRKQLDPAITTLAEALRAKGYATAGFYSGPNLHPAFGFGAGFTTYQNCSGKEMPQAAFEEAISGGDSSELVSLHHDSHSGLSSQTLLSESRAWLENAADEEEPFFLFVHWWDPHYDYTPPAALGRKFDPGYVGEQTGTDFLDVRSVPKDRDLAHILALYDAEIRYTDDHIGQLLESLEKLELAEDTLVIFTADHGDEFFEHGYRGHQRTLYEEAIQIPLVMRLPGSLPAGKRAAGNASLQDVFATAADLLDIPAPDYGMGQSLRPLWERGDDGRTHYSELDLPHRDLQLSAIQSGDMKLIWDHTKDLGEVFDLRADPLEQNPISVSGLFSRDQTDALELGLLRTELARQERARKNIPRTPGFSGEHKLSDELAEELASFGYLEGGGE
jgi:arylsulfatase A-like enzyme